MARVTFEDEATTTDASFEEEIVVAEATINEDTMSMDELEAIEVLLTMSHLHLLAIHDLLRELLMGVQLLGPSLVLRGLLRPK